MARKCPTCGQRWDTLAPRRMRLIREAAGLTLRQLAESSGYHFTYLSKCERGIEAVSRKINTLYMNLRPRPETPR